MSLTVIIEQIAAPESVLLDRDDILLLDRGLAVLRASRGPFADAAGDLQDRLNAAFRDDQRVRMVRAPPE